MKKMMHTSRPFWAVENADVVEVAVVERDIEGAEYRDGQQGSRAAGADDPDGADDAKNNPDWAE